MIESEDGTLIDSTNVLHPEDMRDRAATGGADATLYAVGAEILEELREHNRQFGSACESLRQIQQHLSNIAEMMMRAQVSLR